MSWKIDIKGLDEATARVAALPGNATRARRSALSSVSWWIREELRDYIEMSGDGTWAPLSQATLAIKPTHKKVKYRRGKRKGQYHKVAITAFIRESPLYFFGKFARYRVDKEGTLADIDLGKSPKGAPGTSDPSLVKMIRRHEQGDKTAVSEKMRKFFGASGVPLRADTGTLTIPKRPIFVPVKQRTLPEVPKRFTNKFWAALERYWSGSAKAY